VIETKPLGPYYGGTGSEEGSELEVIIYRGRGERRPGVRIVERQKKKKKPLKNKDEGSF